MASEILKIDENNKPVAGAVTDDSNQFIKMLRIDDTTKGLKVNVVGGIPIVAGSDTQVQYNHLGALGADSHLTFDYTNKQLKVGTGTVLDGSSINPLTTGGNTNTYFASYIQNQLAGISASSDVTGGNNLDDGTLTGHYFDLGINSSVYNDPTLTFASANDSYLYGAGGNLVIGTITVGKKIKFFAGGYASTNIVGSIDSSGNLNLTALTASQIVATDVSKNLVTLATATYPSLTELSYVKGVTSAIQTQINAKGAGTVTAIGVTTANGVSGSSSGGATPNLTITLGAITPSTVNGNTFTTGTYTLTGQAGKTLTFNGSITLTGTDAQTYTFPTTSATIARTDAANTFTGVQTTTQVISTNNAITASGNAATVPVTSKVNTVTNNSAATLTITMATASAVDRQLCIVCILDASAVAQTITWVNTENSTTSVPTTSAGSTTLPLTVGFMYNNATSKWRCVASS